jgi:predicted TIM-barrel fold metal-dependent hydrolase
MGEVAVCELLAQEYPDVDLIIPHLGSFADDWRAQLALIDHLVRNPNIHTDTAGVRRFDLLVEAVRWAGAKKIFFGYHGPWLHPGVELAKVRALNLSASDAAPMLGGNFSRLIDEVDAGSPLRLPESGHSRASDAAVLAGIPGRDPWQAAGRPY